LVLLEMQRNNKNVNNLPYTHNHSLLTSLPPDVFPTYTHVMI
jgi:hypothetical protein